ncbi:hypothetical protein ACT3UG_01145 [Halomonas sp. AOP27-A1-34]|uniref:hypothetical protein n=1 Tax=Halomonas sp. AOP27-A1-34 TaxID=3457708 RepID=UPI0040334425
MNFDTQQALLAVKGIARAMREDAESARNNSVQIEPVALDHYASMLDKARDTLEAGYADSLTKDDTIWLKTVLKSLARSVATAEASGSMISVGEIRAVIEVVDEAKRPGGAS